MTVLLANNATSRLASSLTAAATTLSVATGEGAKFPSPAGGNWFPLTLIKSSGALEILRCTARSGDVFTVTRAQEGTAAQAFSAGDRVEVRLTKAVIDDIIQQITDLSNAALLDANNLSDVEDKASARSNLGLGTAAQGVLTTSASDSTAGRVLKVADFGLGGGAVSLAGSVDTLTATGFYQVGGSTTGTLPASLGQLIHLERGSSNASMQLFASSTLNKYYWRNRWNSTWGAWDELFHTSNVTAFIQTLFDDPDAATARSTLGTVLTSSNVDWTAGRLPKNGDRQLCSARVNFDGTGTVAIREAYNVSSITDNGVGDYTVNFSNGLANTNYSVQASAGDFPAAALRIAYPYSTKTTGAVRIRTATTTSSTVVLADSEQISVEIFGGR